MGGVTGNQSEGSHGEVLINPGQSLFQLQRFSPFPYKIIHSLYILSISLSLQTISFCLELG